MQLSRNSSSIHAVRVESGQRCHPIKQVSDRARSCTWIRRIRPIISSPGSAAFFWAMVSEDGRRQVESVQLFDKVALGLYGALLLVTVIAVARRRHLQPLKFRDPSMLIATVVVTYVANVTSILWLSHAYPYCILEEMAQIPFLSMIVLTMARFWRLFLSSYLTQARLSGKSESWILHRPWLASTRMLWRGSLTIIAVLASIQTSIALSNPLCVWSNSFYYVQSVILMLFWLSTAVMTWKLRSIQDGFYVVTELKILGALILATSVYSIVMMSGDVGNKIPPVLILISCVLQMILQTWFPLWKSYEMAPAESLPSHDTQPIPDSFQLTKSAAGSAVMSPPLTLTSKLVDVLKHPDGFDAMKQHLILEFSVENLLCWQQLYVHKRERRPEYVDEHFRAIYEGFVRDGSPNEVNLNSQLKKWFRDVIVGNPIENDVLVEIKSANKLTSTGHLDEGTELKLCLLRLLYRELLRLMDYDSFQRFKRSSKYRRLVEPSGQVQLGIS